MVFLVGLLVNFAFDLKRVGELEEQRSMDT